MKCPLCEVDLMMTDRQGIEIDSCPKCRGVWLDRHELDKIIDWSSPIYQHHPAENVVVQPPLGSRQFRELHGDKINGNGQNGHERRRKTLLEELFD